MTELNHDMAPPDWYCEVPRSIRRHAIFGFALMAFAFGGFGAWAFRAPLAAAVIAQGSFVATGQNKVVQHLEGGIIERIAVAEGEYVAAGELLLSLDRTASTATERELDLRRHRLEATQARLMAEYNEDDALVFPDHLQAVRDDPQIATILDGQTLAFTTSRRALDQDVMLIERNSRALDVRQVGYATQLASHRRQAELLQGELQDKRQLLERGLIRKPEMTSVERIVVEAEGQIGRLEAEIAEIAQIQAQYATQIEKAQSTYRQAALDELQVIEAELESIREQSRTARNVRRRSDIVAPVAGTVVRLHYHTSGGVIESGKPIAEILPLDAPLIIEAQVPRTEIDSVRRGQTATVRLVALNQRTTPALDGRVRYVSADAIEDRNAAAPREVYLARISLPPDQLGRVPGFTPTPGMPAEIMIETEARTFAQYLAKPILDSMSRAFREQ